MFPNVKSESVSLNGDNTTNSEDTDLFIVTQDFIHSRVFMECIVCFPSCLVDTVLKRIMIHYIILGVLKKRDICEKRKVTKQSKSQY